MNTLRIPVNFKIPRRVLAELKNGIGCCDRIPDLFVSFYQKVLEGHCLLVGCNNCGQLSPVFKKTNWKPTPPPKPRVVVMEIGRASCRERVLS